MLYSLRILRDFEKNRNLRVCNSGLLILTSSSVKPATAAKNQKMLSKIGIKAEMLERQDARSKFPEINFEDCDCILYEPESGYAGLVATATSYAYFG
ncbi:MAG: hypothetical protein ACREBS_03555 [Nitrososphaerales archaeon]